MYRNVDGQKVAYGLLSASREISAVGKPELAENA